MVDKLPFRGGVLNQDADLDRSSDFNGGLENIHQL